MLFWRRISNHGPFRSVCRFYTDSKVSLFFLNFLHPIYLTKYQKIIIISGVTAVGKSAIAVELAKQIDGEIINGDSMQVYKNMRIGTNIIPESEVIIKFFLSGFYLQDYKRDRESLTICLNLLIRLSIIHLQEYSTRKPYKQ